MDLIEAAMEVLGEPGTYTPAVVDSATRYLCEQFDRGENPNPWPQPHQEGFKFRVKDSDVETETTKPHPPQSLEDFEGAAKPPDPPPIPPEPELWAVIALSDGTWGLWHPREQSVLSSPREGLPYTAAIARRDSLNKELLATVYASKPVLAHANSPPSTQPAKTQPTHPSGLVHHYADEAEAQRLAQESQEQFRLKPRK